MATISGGDKLQGFLDGLLKKVTAGGGMQVRVGFVDGGTYPDGTSIAQVAAWNEYGDPGHNRPPRPFFRNMIAAQAPGWGVLAKQCLSAANLDGRRALDMMGVVMSGQLQQSIRDFTSPGLAKSTILARVSKTRYGQVKSPTVGKPLIDTGVMLDHVSHAIAEGS